MRKKMEMRQGTSKHSVNKETTDDLLGLVCVPSIQEVINQYSIFPVTSRPLLFILLFNSPTLNCWSDLYDDDQMTGGADWSCECFDGRADSLKRMPFQLLLSKSTIVAGPLLDSNPRLTSLTIM